MPPWFYHVSSVQIKESKFNSSRWIQIATIGLDNTPRVRTVVFRGWTDNYEMKVFTDIRSQKYQELDKNNNVEICWLFSQSKCQFRFRGTSRIDLGKDKINHWNQLSEESKLMWGWPYPGEDYYYELNKSLVKNTVENEYDNFALLKIDLTHVDQLLLHKPIHIRRRWIRKNEWIEERINP